MTYSTVALSRWFEHRYKFVAYVYNLLEKDFEEVTVFLDTGCYNTMIPWSREVTGTEIRYGSRGVSGIESKVKT
jgi:hypothetical protein